MRKKISGNTNDINNNGNYGNNGNAGNEIAANKTITCKNCETTFEGHFCPNCGQSVKDFDRPFKILFFDIMANMWAFDTRVLKTLKSLILKPGNMALDYVNGRRARYMPPFRLYIFISFIFFLLLNISATNRVNKDWDLLTVKERGDTLTSNRNSVISITRDDNPDDSKSSRDLIDEIESNKEYYVSKFFTVLSWSLFILMPLYASFLWMMFRKRHKYFLGHFIFAINQHAFLFLIFIILLTVNFIFPQKSIYPENWLLLLFPLYIVTGCRKLYSEKWRKIVFRSFAAIFLYMIVMLFAIMIVAYLTLYKAL